MFVIIAAALCSVAVADNRFDTHVDLGNLDWFDRGLYKGSLPYQPCVDLNEFYAYADSNPYDNLGRSDVKSYEDRLSYSDLKRLSAENPGDGITPDDFSRVEDLRCSPVADYNDWARGQPASSPDDYYSLYGYRDQRDFDSRDTHYPVLDYVYPVGPFGLVRTDGYGGFSSPVPFYWY